MNETQILILQSFFSPEEENRLRDALPGFSVRFCGPADWADALPEASFVIGNPPVSLLRSAKKLRLLQLISSGANQYAAPGALPEGAQLACATGSYGPGIAEYLLACTMSLFLRLPAYGANQRAHAWHDEGPVRAIKGASILVVGLGDIGGQYARRCHALGAHVTGVCRTKREAPPFVNRILPAPPGFFRRCPRRAPCTTAPLAGCDRRAGLRRRRCNGGSGACRSSCRCAQRASYLSSFLSGLQISFHCLMMLPWPDFSTLPL